MKGSVDVLGRKMIRRLELEEKDLEVEKGLSLERMLLQWEMRVKVIGCWAW